jgi:hypothetical protein
MTWFFEEKYSMFIQQNISTPVGNHCRSCYYLDILHIVCKWHFFQGIFSYLVVYHNSTHRRSHLLPVYHIQYHIPDTVRIFLCTYLRFLDSFFRKNNSLGSRQKVQYCQDRKGTRCIFQHIYLWVLARADMPFFAPIGSSDGIRAPGTWSALAFAASSGILGANIPFFAPICGSYGIRASCTWDTPAIANSSFFNAKKRTILQKKDHSIS